MLTFGIKYSEMRASFVLFLGIVVLTVSSCRDDFSISENHAEIKFSADTVFLDTLFTNISSRTYSLKLYNRSTNRINIPSIHLGRMESSFYRLNIDGSSGKTFQNIEIPARDSIYVFIEATIDYERIVNPLYIDSLVVDNGIETSDVKLITLVKDAQFLFKSENAETVTLTLPPQFRNHAQETNLQGFYINNITEFTNEKPYVIYGHGIFPENSDITVQPGAEFYFHDNSGLVFLKNTSLNIQGSLDEKVIFQGDRLESQYSDLPGQWTGIWFQEENSGATLKNVIIKNANIGLYSEVSNQPDTKFTLENVEIYNCSDFGLIGRNSHIDGKNLVINNSGKSALAIIEGGCYSFIHTTLSNFWNYGIRKHPSVYVSNSNLPESSDLPTSNDLEKAEFKNCIIEGNQSIELELHRNEDSTFNHYFENTLIRFDDASGNYQDNPDYDFENLGYFKNVYFNQEPDFKDPSKNELFVGLNSFVIGKGNNSTTELVPLDLLGKTRALPADLGAYQHFDFEN